jgi:hypothetical protein
LTNPSVGVYSYQRRREFHDMEYDHDEKERYARYGSPLNHMNHGYPTQKWKCKFVFSDGEKKGEVCNEEFLSSARSPGYCKKHRVMAQRMNKKKFLLRKASVAPRGIEPRFTP